VSCSPVAPEMDGLIGGMKSELKMKVVAKKMPDYDGKRWVWVDFRGRTEWIPSFEDLFRVVQAICYCEDEKYPQGEGRGMVRRFLIDSCGLGMDWPELKAKYNIPERD